MTIRVVHVVNDATSGGAQRLLTHLASDRSVEAHLVVLLGPGVLTEEFSRRFSSVRYLSLKPNSPFSLARGARELSSITRDLQPHIRHSHLSQADMLNRLAPPGGAVLVSTVHNSRLTGRTPISRGTTRAAMYALRTFDSVVACDTSAEEFLRVGYRVSSEVIRNGVPMPPPTATPRAQGGYFLSIARWARQKRHDVLIAAFAEVHRSSPEARLVLVGEGMEESNHELRRLVDSAGLPPDTVRLVGYRSDPEHLMGGAMALVISSDYEGLPLAGIEAAAHGLPVVSTNVGGCSDLVTQSTFLAAPGDPGDLARAMQAMVDLDRDPEARAKTGDASREIAERSFDIQQTIAGYSDLYAGLLDRVGAR